MTDYSRSGSPSASVPIQPTRGWMLARPYRVLALGFGAGLMRVAPGTWGTLAGWLLWVVLVSSLPQWGIAAVLVAGFFLGSWACQLTGRDMGAADHGSIVWDEIIAIWLVLWLAPTGWGFQVLAVVLFRFFDILKPPPVRYFDRRYKNGIGVMLDDILAALYSLLVIAIIVRTGPFS